MLTRKQKLNKCEKVAEVNTIFFKEKVAKMTDRQKKAFTRKRIAKCMNRKTIHTFSVNKYRKDRNKLSKKLNMLFPD